VWERKAQNKVMEIKQQNNGIEAQKERGREERKSNHP
jgi:hypothetical protein